jgi:hypothetical protein
LAVDPVPTSRFWPLTYLRHAWSTQLGLLSFSIVLALTWGGLWLAGWGLGQAQPVEVVIKSVEVLTPPDGTTDRTLRVEITAPAPGSCLRLSYQFLHQDGPGEEAFYALGTTMNGDGFRDRHGAGFGMEAPSGKPLDFALMLPLSSAIPAGQYHYVYRSVYTCLWLGGIVQRRLMFEAPAVPLHLGPPRRRCQIVQPVPRRPRATRLFVAARRRCRPDVQPGRSHEGCGTGSEQASQIA